MATADSLPNISDDQLDKLACVISKKNAMDIHMLCQLSVSQFTYLMDSGPICPVMQVVRSNNIQISMSQLQRLMCACLDMKHPVAPGTNIRFGSTLTIGGTQ